MSPVHGDELERWYGRGVPGWAGEWGVPALRIYRRVGSTSDVVRELAGQGAPHGTTVLADEQTHGRGRRGRSWQAPPGSSLLLSMLLRPRAGEQVLSLRLGMAAARAIEDVATVRVELKWPNDLLVRGRKVGGVLCEGSSDQGRITFVVAGLGINLRQQTNDWPPELAGLATSLEAEAGAAVAAPRLAGRVAEEWLAAAASGGAVLDESELARFRSRDALRGRPVTVEGSPAGTAAGITPAGALRLLRDGQEQVVVSGTVRAAEPTDSP